MIKRDKLGRFVSVKRSAPKTKKATKKVETKAVKTSAKKTAKKAK